MLEVKFEIHIDDAKADVIADEMNAPLTTKGTRKFVGHCSIKLSVPRNKV